MKAETENPKGETYMTAMKNREKLRYNVEKRSRTVWEWTVYKKESDGTENVFESGFSRNVSDARFGIRRTMEAANLIF